LDIAPAPDLRLTQTQSFGLAVSSWSVSGSTSPETETVSARQAKGTGVNDDNAGHGSVCPFNQRAVGAVLVDAEHEVLPDLITVGFS
jgi:hypothetical protein